MHPQFVVEKSITNIVVILQVLCINLRCSAAVCRHRVVTSCGYIMWLLSIKHSLRYGHVLLSEFTQGHYNGPRNDKKMADANRP